MKYKNGILVLLLVVMLTGIYFYEEKGGVERQALAEKALQLIPYPIEHLQTIKLGKHFEVYKKGENYFTKHLDYPVQQEKMQQTLTHLGSLMIERKLSLDERAQLERKQFFPSDEATLEFGFQEGKVQVLVGQQVAVSEAFYIEVTTPIGTSWLIAKDPRPREDIYLKSEVNSPHRYQELLSLTQVKDQEYYDLRFLGFDAGDSAVLNFKHWSQVRVHTPLAAQLKLENPLEWTLDWKRKISQPPLPQSEAMNESWFKDWESRWYHLMAEIIPVSEVKHLKLENYQVIQKWEIIDQQQSHFTITMLKATHQNEWLLQPSWKQKLYRIDALSAQELLLQLKSASKKMN